jgi:hypothetical protein
MISWFLGCLGPGSQDFRVQGYKTRFLGSELRVQGSGFRVQDLGSGFRI